SSGWWSGARCSTPRTTTYRAPSTPRSGCCRAAPSRECERSGCGCSARQQVLDAAVDDVDDVVEAESLEQARRDRGARARVAHDSDRAALVDAVRDVVDVVVGRVDRARDVALVPLRELAHVEELHPFAPRPLELIHSHPLHGLDREPLLAP